MTFQKPSLCPLRSHWFDDPMYCKKWSSKTPLIESFQPGFHYLQNDLISNYHLKIWIQSGEPWLGRHRCKKNDIIEDWLKGKRRSHFPIAILKFLRNFTSNPAHISKTWTCEIIVLEKCSCFFYLKKIFVILWCLKVNGKSWKAIPISLTNMVSFCLDDLRK